MNAPVSVSRARFAAFRGVSTGSQARADRRGQGPGEPLHMSKTHVVYLEENVVRWCKERGIEWPPKTERRSSGGPARGVGVDEAVSPG